MEYVIAVDEWDRDLGAVEKMEAHRTGTAHRAVSVMLADSRRRVLLQRRSTGKYHCGGQWANTCCGHPRPGEAAIDAARRRLAEELGLVCDLRPAGLFRYTADVGGGLMENELVHLFVGRHDGPVAPNPREVMEVRWVPAAAVGDVLAGEPCTPWFRRYAEGAPAFVAASMAAGYRPPRQIKGWPV